MIFDDYDLEAMSNLSLQEWRNVYTKARDIAHEEDSDDDYYLYNQQIQRINAILADRLLGL